MAQPGCPNRHALLHPADCGGFLDRLRSHLQPDAGPPGVRRPGLGGAALFAATNVTSAAAGRESSAIRCSMCIGMAPAAPSALFLGKALANLAFVLTVVEAVLAPVFVLFLQPAPAWRGMRWLWLILPLGTWAHRCSTVRFFSCAQPAQLATASCLLPLVLFPISIPASAGRGDTARLTASSPGEFDPALWVRLLLWFRCDRLPPYAFLLFGATFCMPSSGR